MTRHTFAQQLENAADLIKHVPREDLQILLRRAALRLRNTVGLALDPEMAELLDAIAGEMKLTRYELIRSILNEWLIGNSYLPANVLDEDGDVEGNT